MYSVRFLILEESAAELWENLTVNDIVSKILEYSEKYDLSYWLGEETDTGWNFYINAYPKGKRISSPFYQFTDEELAI